MIFSDNLRFTFYLILLFTVTNIKNLDFLKNYFFFLMYLLSIFSILFYFFELNLGIDSYKYWKIGYAPFASNYGVKHFWLQNDRPTSWSRVLLRLVDQEWCMTSILCRRIARTDDVYFTDEMIKFILKRTLLWAIKFYFKWL